MRLQKRRQHGGLRIRRCNGALTPSACVLTGRAIQDSYVHGDTTTLSLPDRASVSLGTFEPDQPGDYQLRISATGGEKRQFSLTEGAFLGGVAKLGLRLILACLLGLFGVVFFVLGLIFVLLKAKPRLQSAGS